MSKGPKKKDQGAADGPAEAEILFPDVTLDVRDPDTGEAVPVTVREFRFREGLEIRHIARPIIAGLADVVETSEELELELVDGILAENAESWLALIAKAADVDPEWLGRLTDSDGDAMAEAMWSANRDFLLRRVVTEVVARRKASGSGSPKSSTSSSGQDTDAGTQI